MKAKQTAAELRALAVKLEADAEKEPHTVGDVIRSVAPQQCNVSIRLPMDSLLNKSFSAREFAVSSAGQQLGHFIANSLDYAWSRPDMFASGVLGIRQNYDRLGSLSYCEEEYTASVYVLTPHELTKLVEAAFNAGRNR